MLFDKYIIAQNSLQEPPKSSFARGGSFRPSDKGLTSEAKHVKFEKSYSLRNSPWDVQHNFPLSDTGEEIKLNITRPIEESKISEPSKEIYFF